jgi:hypothetical protein
MKLLTVFRLNLRVTASSPLAERKYTNAPSAKGHGKQNMGKLWTSTGLISISWSRWSYITAPQFFSSQFPHITSSSSD